MPNWCFANVSFTGTKVKELSEAFKDAYDKTVDERRMYGESLLKMLGQEKEEKDYFYDISILEEPSTDVITPTFKISFDTKWSPKPDEIVEIAKIYGLNFRYYYEELGNGIYGCFVYEEEILNNFELPKDSIIACYDEDGDFKYDEALELLEQIIDPD